MREGERKAGILVSLRRGGEEMLLRGERMRSGRRDSKINRRNLSRDREISLTMRALVRAKWSERGGRWRRGVREEGVSEVEKVGKRKTEIYTKHAHAAKNFPFHPLKTAQMLYCLTSHFLCLFNCKV